MSLRREPGRIVVDVKTSHAQAAIVILAGAAVGLFLFLVLRPYTPDLSLFSASDSQSDSASWHEAPRFEVEVSGRPHLGTGDAAVSIVEFTDYGCPYCRRHAKDVLPVLLDSLGAEIDYVVRHFPIPALTPNAISAAIAAECAFEQDLFWQYKAALQQETVGFQDERLRAHAAAAGIDVEMFESCTTDESKRNIVESDILDAWEYGVTGTPTFFINGKRFQGARPLEELMAYVRLALLEADSGFSANTN